MPLHGITAVTGVEIGPGRVTGKSPKSSHPANGGIVGEADIFGWPPVPWPLAVLVY